MRPSKMLHSLHKMSRISMHTHPDAVDKDLGGVRRSQRLVLFEHFHIPLNHELNNGITRCANGDVAHKSQVLDEAASLSFRSLGRANQTPMSIVQLSRFSNLSISTN